MSGEETSQDLIRNEVLTVFRDGEEVEVYNWATIEQPARVRGHNPVVQKFEAEIGAGDSMMTPDAITHWVDEELQHEFDIDVRDQGIEVIDPTDDEVDVL